MVTSDERGWHDRSVLRSAQRAASLPRWARRLWYAVLGAFVASYLWDGATLWNVDRAAAHGELVKGLLFGLAAFLAIELDAALRLLARLGLGERADERRAPPAAAREAVGAPGRLALGEAEARRLARAPAYAEQLERIRWIHPLLTAGAVAAAAAALAWVEVPRPLDLTVAGLAGVSVAAALAVAALRGWVQLAAALAQRGGAPGPEARTTQA